MCGRAVLSTPVEEIAEIFALDVPPEPMPARYNIAPTQPIAMIVRSGDSGKRMLRLARWGLVPSWSQDLGVGAKMINARVESLAEHRAFREALAARRCLVVVDGFYEWSPEGRTRQPYYVHRRDGRPLGLAALWDSWRAPAGQILESCTILTTASAPPVSTLHDRMPLVLELGDVDTWLDVARRSPADLACLTRPPSADSLVFHAVDKLVNSPANDVPACVLPAQDGTLRLFG